MKDRMLRSGAAVKKGEGCCWGGLQVIYPEGELHFPKGELTHTLFDCLKACLLRFTFTLGSLICLLGDLHAKISDLGGEQFGRDQFKPDVITFPQM